MKLLGQDVSVVLNQLNSISQNTLAWMFSWSWWRTCPLFKSITEEKYGCVIIRQPGGFETLQIEALSQEMGDLMEDSTDIGFPGYHNPSPPTLLSIPLYIPLYTLLGITTRQ